MGALSTICGSPQVNLIAIVLAIVAIVGLLLAYFYIRRLNGEITRRLTELEDTVKLVLPISVMFRASLVKTLTHDYAPEMDFLLAKMVSEERLSSAERSRLYVLLQERAVEAPTEDERGAARMMPDAIERADRDEKK